MRNETIYKTLAVVLILLAGCQQAWAQRYPERRMTRSGNRQYEKGDFVEGETRYREALEKNPAFREAAFNLGDALYRQERYGDAAEAFGKLADPSSGHAPSDRVASYYNQGNALFRNKDYRSALEAYKQALRIDPDDEQARFNLAYTQKMLENQQGGGNSQEPQGGQDRQNGQDKSQQNDRGDGENRDNPEQQGSERRDGSEQQDTTSAEPPREGMGREEADRMLDAVQRQEDKTRDKLREQQGTGVARSGKNW